MRRALLVWIAFLSACASEVRSSAGDATPVESEISQTSDFGAEADSGSTPLDVVYSEDTPDVADDGLATAPDEGGPADTGAPATCDCDTAASIVWLQSSSHGSCSPPAPGEIRSICKEAHTQEFETGDTFGVSGCKFEVSCR